MMFEALSQFNSKNRVGVVIGIRKNPTDTDLKLINVFQERVNDKTGETEPVVRTLKTTARNVQEAGINEEMIVRWNVVGTIHAASSQELQKLHIEANELMAHYHKWLELKHLSASISS